MDRFTICVPQADVLEIDARGLVDADGEWPRLIAAGDRDSASVELVRQRIVLSVFPTPRKERVCTHPLRYADGAGNLEQLIPEPPVLTEIGGERR
jgi:hypothetical protein